MEFTQEQMYIYYTQDLQFLYDHIQNMLAPQNSALKKRNR